MINLHDYAFEGIDGQPLPGESLRGKAVLLVNTASECGFTPQYRDLQGLWERYRDRGLVVLGAPSNDFGGQEPGDEDEIRAFCTDNYAVDFPLTRKIAVLGDDAHPLYRGLQDTLGDAGVPKWNFHKYLFAPDGELVEMWGSKTAPLDAEVIDAVESQLPD